MARNVDGFRKNWDTWIVRALTRRPRSMGSLAIRLRYARRSGAPHARCRTAIRRRAHWSLYRLRSMPPALRTRSRSPLSASTSSLARRCFPSPCVDGPIPPPRTPQESWNRLRREPHGPTLPLSGPLRLVASTCLAGSLPLTRSHHRLCLGIHARHHAEIPLELPESRDLHLQAAQLLGLPLEEGGERT